MTKQSTACKSPAPWPVRVMAYGFAVTALVLSACGGVPDKTLPAPEPTASEPTPPAPPATLLAGLYKGTLDSNPNREFLALIVPALGKDVQVYGWYYNADDQHLAHLYAGQLELGIEGNASNVPNSWRIIEGVNSYPATANVATSTLQQLHADLSISRSSVSNYKLSATALPPTGCDVNAAPVSLSNSNWNGYWSTRNNTAAGRLQFGSNGAANASDTFWPCFSGSAPLTWTWTAQSLNYFKVTLSLGSMTLCPEWQKQYLEGVATVSRQNGGDQLDMMLLDGTGAGISYRGTR